jgi:hypothetical protein
LFSWNSDFFAKTYSEIRIYLQPQFELMGRLLPYIKQYILFFAILMSLSGHTQTKLSDIDTSRIKQKCIRTFLRSQMDSGIVYFEDFRPSVTEQTDSSKFNSYVSHFHLKESLSIACSGYQTTHPAQIWHGKVISYGFIYSPKSKHIIFAEDSYQGIETGQLFFLEMNILCGIIRFPICFEVTKVDSVKHEYSFSYVDSGPSKGSQTIRLEQNSNTETNIIHRSIHQTRHYIRDRTFYPIYHRKAISELHRNIKRNLAIVQ